MPAHASATAWLDDLQTFLNAAAGAHAVQINGARLYRDQVRCLPKHGNPDPMIYLTLGQPGDPDVEFYQGWRLSEIETNLAENGPLMLMAGHQWAVHVYAEWEEYFRPGLAAALGIHTTELRVPLLGDLRRIRNDVIHNRGIASTESTGRCEVLREWFQKDDVISIGQLHVVEFMKRFPWTELRTMVDRASS